MSPGVLNTGLILALAAIGTVFGLDGQPSAAQAERDVAAQAAAAPAEEAAKARTQRRTHPSALEPVRRQHGTAVAEGSHGRR